jgi:hypothetical protein
MAKPRKPGQKGKPKDKRGDKPKEATILIPLAYNDGTCVSWQMLQSIYDEIYLAFHGWTIEDTVQGAYRMQSGQKRVEELQKVSVVLDESQIGELEAMVRRWCAKLGQETILLKIADFVVKFVPPETEAEKR